VGTEPLNLLLAIRSSFEIRKHGQDGATKMVGIEVDLGEV